MTEQDQDDGRAGANGSPREPAPRGTVKLGDQLCFALYAATNAVTRAYRPRLAEIDLTYPQYLVMMVLWQDLVATPSAIATRLKLGANAITPLLDQLENAGLVRRHPAADDRRSTEVHLTPDGRRLERAAQKAQAEVVCDTGLGGAELAELREALRALTDHMVPSAPERGNDGRREGANRRNAPKGGGR